MKLVLSKVKHSVRKALEEDGCFSDLSIHTKKNKKIQRIKANVVSRQDGFLSGGPWFEEAFKIVDKKAKISDNVEIGPYCIIGPEVEIGSNTELTILISNFFVTCLSSNK